MAFTIISKLFLLCTIIHLSIGGESPLILTPLIDTGKISEAQALAQVILPKHKDVLISEEEFPNSYSGFITVNKEFETNYFFWFFPALNNSETAPIILWSDGGPGSTCFNSLFNMNGPFKFNMDKKFVRREDDSSLHSEFNIIYLDNPADVGFSFTSNEEGFASSGVETASNVYEFLLQFFKLFPTLRNNEFYNGGVSYGGTYATAIAHYIHTKNSKASGTKEEINLKGLVIDSPWFHPPSQVDYGTWLHNAGLITFKSKEYFDKQRDTILDLLEKEKFAEATELWYPIVIEDIMSYTGLPSFYDYVDQDLDHISLLMHNYTDLVTSPSFRSALHTGSQNFKLFSPEAQGKMKGNFMTSVKHLLEELLETEKYKVLLISGDSDLITGHMGVEEIALNLQWKGGDEFRAQVDKQVWMDENKYAGNIQSSQGGKLTYALVRNGGHGAGIQQPRRVLELIKGFINGEIGAMIGKGNVPSWYPDLTEDLKEDVKQEL